MLLRKYIVVLSLLSCSLNFHAQRTETALNFDEKSNHIGFEVENDFLFQSDHYYTGGISIFITSSQIKKTPAQYLSKAKSEFAFSFSGFALEHRMYTPYSIENPFAIENDRPYCAYILLSNYSVLINPRKNLKISNEIGLGILGPMAKGKEFQSGVHNIIGSALPLGWENQLSNSFIIDYQLRIEKSFFNNWIRDHFTPIAEIRIGTLFDELALGLMIKFGNSGHFLANYETVNKNKFVWNIVFESKFRAVVYDATIHGGVVSFGEGNALSYSHSTFHQYHFRMGFNIYYKRMYIRYMHQMNSKDFTNGLVHRYAGIILGFAF